MECMMSAWDDRNHSVKTTVKYILRNGQKIYGELLTPEVLSGPFPTVIVSHGFGNTLDLPSEPHGWTEEGKREASKRSFRFFEGLVERENGETDE